MIKWTNYIPSKLTICIGTLSILWIIIESFILNTLPELFSGGDIICTILTNFSYSLFAGVAIYYLSVDISNNIRMVTIRIIFTKKMYRSIRSYKRVINSIGSNIKLNNISKADFINEITKHPFRRIGGMLQTTPSGGMEMLGFPDQLVRHKSDLQVNIHSLLDRIFYLDAKSHDLVSQLAYHKLWEYIEDHNNFIGVNSIPKGSSKSSVNISKYEAELLYDVFVIYNSIYDNKINWNDIPTCQFFE